MAWLAANLPTVQLYMEAIYALQNATVVVDSNKVSGGVKITGDSATIDFASNLKLPSPITNPSTNSVSLQTAIVALLDALRATKQLPS